MSDVRRQCTLALGTSCGYPPGYFDRLDEDNDEDLEIERNDVRDVARSVCALEAGAGAAGRTPPSVLILDHVVGACDAAVRCAAPGVLPPETAVHVLSSLAKPLNRMGQHYRERPCPVERAILTKSLLALGSVCDRLMSSFESHALSQILPLSRLALMATAALSPLFASLAAVMRPLAQNNTNEHTF